MIKHFAIPETTTTLKLIQIDEFAFHNLNLHAKIHLENKKIGSLHKQE